MTTSADSAAMDLERFARTTRESLMADERRHHFAIATLAAVPAEFSGKDGATAFFSARKGTSLVFTTRRGMLVACDLGSDAGEGSGDATTQRDMGTCLADYAAQQQRPEFGLVCRSAHAEAAAAVAPSLGLACETTMSMANYLLSPSAFKSEEAEKARSRGLSLTRVDPEALPLLLPRWTDLCNQEVWASSSSTPPSGAHQVTSDAALRTRLREPDRAAFLLRCPDLQGPTAPFGAMAWVSGRTPNLARLGMVFVPRELRGKQLGKAITALLCEALFDGADVVGGRAGAAPGVVLFADETNPVSNRLYQGLGFVIQGHQYILRCSPA